MRLGLIGYGEAGGGMHAPLVEAVDGLDLAVIVTADPRRQALVHARHPDAVVLRETDDLWERDDVDAVVVATPNRTHLPLAHAALERDLPVMVDAPLASTLADAEWLVAQAATREVPLTVFHNRRWDGDFLTVRALLAQGALGAPFRFESRLERLRPDVEAGTWRTRPEVSEGGGLLLDVGYHLVDQAIQLFGDPVAVYGETARVRAGAEVEDEAFLALEHPGGMRSHLTFGVLSALPGPRFRVLGTAGGLLIESLDPQERHLRMGLEPDDADFGLVRPGRIVARGGERDVPIRRGAWTAVYERFRDAVRGDGDVPVDPADALVALHTLELARPAPGSAV